MSATERRTSEQAFHDRQARRRAALYTRRPDGLVFDDSTYLDHETWVRPAFRQLGPVGGKRVLDFGCGHGMATVVLARRGARVTALDLSAGYLEEARRRARANGVEAEFVRGNGEQLPFADGSFERVWGGAVLHHLDPARAGRELFRVLRPGGVAVFCEPWGENRLLTWARRGLPYPGKERTPDEQPLGRAHLRQLRHIFGRVEVRGFQLLSMVRRVVGPGPFTACLDWCDDLLLRRLPRWQNYCRYVVLTLRR